MKEVHLLAGRERDPNSEKLAAFSEEDFHSGQLGHTKDHPRIQPRTEGVTQGTGTRQGESNAFLTLFPSLLTTNNILATSRDRGSLCIIES